MLKSYDVYLKNGEILKLELLRFEYDEERFTFYDSKDSVTSDAFLSLEDVAALIPEDQSEYKFWYVVHLKTGHSIEVSADCFEIADPPSVRFLQGKPPQPNKEIEGIYVAQSEVIAIMPRERT